MKERFHYIDNLKGFLIILVVLGHCIQYSISDFDHNIVFRIIYSFHMPLFMFVSGFVSYKAEYKKDSIRKRFVQLIIPFVAWAMLGLATTRSWNLIWFTQPDTGLWFLWVLFWIGVIFVSLSIISDKLNISLEMLTIFCCAILIGVLFISKLMFGFHLIAWYLPFYCLGAFLRKHYGKFIVIFKKAGLSLCVVFCVMVMFWMRNEPPTFMSSGGTAITFGYKFLTGLAGCGAFFYLSTFANCKILYLSCLGGVTLGVYAIHLPLVRFIAQIPLFENIARHGGQFIMVGVLFLMTCIVTGMLYWILSRFNLTSRIFLGK